MPVTIMDAKARDAMDAVLSPIVDAMLAAGCLIEKIIEQITAMVVAIIESCVARQTA